MGVGCWLNWKQIEVKFGPLGFVGRLAFENEKTMRMEQMKNKTLADNTFLLSDFYLTAYLICRGMELLRAEPEGPGRVTFVLKDSPGRPQLIQEFYGHRAKIDPIAYKSVIIDLKSMIHHLKGSGRRPAIQGGSSHA